MDEGSIVFSGVVLQPSVHVDAHATLNTSCSVDHDSRLERFTHVAPGARLAGSVTIGEGGFVGIGSSIIPGCQIGEWSIVGAGAVVIRDVPTSTTVVGVPARVTREQESGRQR